MHAADGFKEESEIKCELLLILSFALMTVFTVTSLGYREP